MTFGSRSSLAAHGDAAAGTDRIRPLAELRSVSEGEPPLNLAQHPHYCSCLFGGALSFECVVRFDGGRGWARIFDFSHAADEDSITAGTVGFSTTLHFTVFRGKEPLSVIVPRFFVSGEEATMLCTVSGAGHMKVFKNGSTVGENADGQSPLTMERPHLFVGGHFLYPQQRFRGAIRDVKIWDEDISWPHRGGLSSALPLGREGARDPVEI